MSPSQQCNATDLAPVTVTYSPPSGGTVGSGPFTVPSVTTVGQPAALAAWRGGWDGTLVAGSC
jgi:hypothetical protein